MITHPLAGVYVAAVTPLKEDYSPDLEAIPRLLKFYAERDCHGALLLGTTGEGPSFSPEERKDIWGAATKIREEHPEFRLMAGTGSPSLEETAAYNKLAFELGFDAVVTLPPFYFRTASEDGLFTWFSQIINRSVPGDGWLLGYHFPKVSGVPLSASLLKRLRDAYPEQFGGLKDSSGELAHAKTMVDELEDRLVLVGNDSLMTENLAYGGSGCITALANLVSPDLRQIWDTFALGEPDAEAQQRVDSARELLNPLTPFAASLKGLLPKLTSLPQWAVKPPLMPFAEEALEEAAQSFKELLPYFND
jgi:4-hydroxy-tetrahydrodipicolinate synthase